MLNDLAATFFLTMTMGCFFFVFVCLFFYLIFFSRLGSGDCNMSRIWNQRVVLRRVKQCFGAEAKGFLGEVLKASEVKVEKKHEFIWPKKM